MDLNLPNTYEIYSLNEDGIEQAEYTERIMATTPGKAKYQTYLKYEDCFCGFSDFLKHIRIRTIGKGKIEHMFGDKSRFNFTKERRGLSFATIGMRVDHRGNPGIIVGANLSENFNVYFPHLGYVTNCHPHYELVYYSKAGEVLRDFRK